MAKYPMLFIARPILVTTRSFGVTSEDQEVKTQEKVLSCTMVNSGKHGLPKLIMVELNFSMKIQKKEHTMGNKSQN